MQITGRNKSRYIYLNTYILNTWPVGITMMMYCPVITAELAVGRRRRRRAGWRRCISQPQVVLAVATHAVRVGCTTLPLDANPAVISEVADNSALTIKNDYNH